MFLHIRQGLTRADLAGVSARFAPSHVGRCYKSASARHCRPGRCFGHGPAARWTRVGSCRQLLQAGHSSRCNLCQPQLLQHVEDLDVRLALVRQLLRPPQAPAPGTTLEDRRRTVFEVTPQPPGPNAGAQRPAWQQLDIVRDGLQRRCEARRTHPGGLQQVRVMAVCLCRALWAQHRVSVESVKAAQRLFGSCGLPNCRRLRVPLEQTVPTAWSQPSLSVATAIAPQLWPVNRASCR